MKYIISVIFVVITYYGFGQTEILSTDVGTFTTASEGDYYITTDTDEMYVGTSNGTLRPVGRITVRGTNPDDMLLWDDTNQKWMASTLNTWALNGNANTDSSSDFIGTTDAQELIFRTQNEPIAKFGIGKNNYVNFSLTGIQNQQTYTGSATLLNLDLNIGSAGNPSEASILQNVTGISNQFLLQSGSRISGTTNLYNNRIWNINSGQNLSTVRGFYMDHQLEGNDITDLSFLEFNFRRQRVNGSVTNYYGLRHRFLNPTQMDTENFYGIHNDAMTSTDISNYYGYYQGNLGTAANRFSFFYDGDDINTKDVVITGLGHVGIGTNAPVAPLEIISGIKDDSGLQLTDLTSSSVTTANALPIGVDVTGRVVAVDIPTLESQKINFGGRWTNTDTTTDLNTNNYVIVPLLDTESYKDDGTVLYEVTANELTVKEAGKYDIRATISVTSTVARSSINARIFVNGNPVGAIAATGYIRNSGNPNQGALRHSQSSLHISDILALNANDVVSIRAIQEARNGTVTLSGAGESNFIINKLR